MYHILCGKQQHPLNSKPISSKLKTSIGVTLGQWGYEGSNFDVFDM